MKTTKLGVASFVAMSLILSKGIAQEDNAENQLKIPEDLQVKQRGKMELEEYRVGGRLERVVVRRDDGITEVYQNHRNDTVWAADESSLGEVQNVRQWRLGTW